MTLMHIDGLVNFEDITDFRLHTLIHTLIDSLFFPECLLHIKLLNHLIASWVENLDNSILTAHDKVILGVAVQLSEFLTRLVHGNSKLSIVGL